MWLRNEKWAGLLKGVSLTGKIGDPALLRYSFSPDKLTKVVPARSLRLKEYSDELVAPLRKYLISFFESAASTWWDVARISFIEDNNNPNFLILETNLTIPGNAITVPHYNSSNPHHLIGAILFVSPKYLTKTAQEFFSSTDEFWYWWFNTLAHEIGHAIGLKHPEDIIIPDMPGIQQPFTAVPRQFDNNCFTVMSYTKTCGNYFASVRSLDIAAAQYLYGPNTVHDSDDHYALVDFLKDAKKIQQRKTIWDGGGTDTISAYPYEGPAVIDLRAGESHSSQIGDMKLTVAFDSTIENVEAGQGDNIIFGNTANNIIDLRPSNGKSIVHFESNFGNDTVYGFKLDKDILNISKVGSREKLILNCRSTYNGMIVEFSNGNSILLPGVRARLDKNIIGNHECTYDDHIFIGEILNDPKFYVPVSILLGLFEDKFKRLGVYSQFLIDLAARMTLPANGYILQKMSSSIKKECVKTDKASHTHRLAKSAAVCFSAATLFVSHKAGYFQPLLPLAVNTALHMTQKTSEQNSGGVFSNLKNSFWKSIPGFNYLNKTFSLSETALQSYTRDTAIRWQNYLQNHSEIINDSEQFNQWLQTGIQTYCHKKGIKVEELDYLPIRYEQVEEYLNQNSKNALKIE